MKLRRISEVEEYYKGRNDIYESLYLLLDYSIKNKKEKISKGEIEVLWDELQSAELLKKSNDDLELNYNSIGVCYVVLKYSEKILNRDFPDSILDATVFIEDFGREIRKPKENFLWNSRIGLSFELFMWLYFFELKNINIADYYFDLQNNPNEHRRELFSLVNFFGRILDYHKVEYSDLEKLYLHFLSSEDKTHVLHDYPSKLIESDKVYAEQFYQYLKENNSHQIRSRFLIHLYKIDANKYLTEVSSLISDSETDGVYALTWIEYTSHDNMVTAFNEIPKGKISAIESIRILPIFYTRLLKNPNCTSSMSRNCFMALREITLMDIDDKSFRNQLVYWVRIIEGFDQEKYALFCLFSEWGDSNVLIHYFDNFTSSKYLFKIIQDFFKQIGTSVNLKLFESAFPIAYGRNKAEFQNEILELIGNEVASIRFAGISILTGAYRGVYEIDLLKLNRDQQMTILISLVNFPMNIEKIVSLLFQLRNSEFKEVRDVLKKEVIILFQAYESYFMELLTNTLDNENKNDKLWLKELKELYSKYEKKRREKEKYNELNPFKNDRNTVERYYQIEAEKNRKMFDKAQAGSITSAFGTTIGVIRGSAFKLEGDSPQMLGTYSTRIPMDRRFYIDPEKFYWEIDRYFNS